METRVAVGSLLASNPPLAKEARWRMQVWYKDATNRPPPPIRVTIYGMTLEQVALYMCMLTPPPLPREITYQWG